MFNTVDKADFDDMPLPCRDVSNDVDKPLNISSLSAEEMVSANSNPWSPFAYQDLGWKRFKPKEPKAFFGSLALHSLVIASFFVSFDDYDKIKPVKDEVKSFTVSLSKGDDFQIRMPVASIEAEKDQEEIKEVPEPVEEPSPISKSNMPAEQVKPPEPQEASSSEGEVGETPTPALNEGGGQMIWTPPAPGSTAGPGSDSTGEKEEVRVSMPVVEMPTGASEPILLSYDQARYSDAVAMREASRLSNTGTIMMAVAVDEKGLVTSCVITSTSGSIDLDERGCALVSSYRYRPAQDAKGKPYAAIVSEMLEWAKDGNFSEVIKADENPVPQTDLQKVRDPERLKQAIRNARRNFVPRVSMPKQ